MTAADTQSIPETERAAGASVARAWTVTALLVVFMMINFADKAVFGLAADEIRADLSLSGTDFGLANSAFFLLFSVSAVAVGMLADRVSLRWLLLAMALLWSVAQVPAALGGGLAVLIGSRVVLGGAEGPAFPVAQQTTFSWFPDHRRNLPGALVTLGVTIGVIIAAPLLTWLIDNHGWRSALWALAGVGAVWCAGWLAFGAVGGHRDDRPAAAAKEKATATVREKGAVTGARRASWPEYRRIFGSRTWIGVTVAYFTSYWGVALMLVWLPSYLKNALGYSSATAGTLVAVPWAVGALVLLGQAAVTARLLRRGVASRWARGRVGAALLAIGAVSLLALPLVHGAAGKAVLLFLGFGFGGAFAAVAATIAAELAPVRRRGGTLGTMNALVTTSGLIAPTLVGAMVDAQGRAGYQNAAFCYAVLLAVGALAAAVLIDPERDAARVVADVPDGAVR